MDRRTEACSTRAARGMLIVTQATIAEMARKAAAATLVVIGRASVPAPATVRSLAGLPDHVRCPRRRLLVDRKRRRTWRPIVLVQPGPRVAPPGGDSRPQRAEPEDRHDDRNADAREEDVDDAGSRRRGDHRQERGER